MHTDELSDKLKYYIKKNFFSKLLGNIGGFPDYLQTS